ncbi:MAG TPA: MBL fold metallo-hydrolase [Candidatus Binatia bacterium]
MKLTVLGSGDAFCSGGALHSCNLLEHEGGTLMLECGPGVLAGMKRLGIPTGAPDALLISHLHGDHFGGIPFLFLEYLFENPRSRPLTILGPPTILERSFALYSALYRELQSFELPFEIRCEELHPGSRTTVAGFEIEAFRVTHNAEPFSLGYRIVSPDATMLFSGDSAWNEAFVEQSKDCDVFLCECCTMEPTVPMHTSYSELLAQRKRLGCRRLLLTHLGADVRLATDFRFERVEDGMVFDLRRGS